ncbi:UDP-galactose transporter Gms1 [Coemansia thaxteri]|uniref:UDP-galactose transporter Gms1 n=1 Tax=Coemansia thaxteri TaxID=2663907 RepID=A0A9W8ELC6_9FUNG|nr:UDP-galactose transporter Gms1 [Coemansia thaxteri]KAJ2008665.1 UDP-galactose transporter Gms1 [Coemansia thaxteri]KAJ2469940.1 UDP-galactose transporter Gms1 [Coemansia sp. RSA 2322]KAJ2481136.1 UDP-galactose transporter Gms1 [Coemansia sp. RSA 2320]
MSGAGPLLFGVPLKYVSLVVLTVQNSVLVLIMHYSRIVSNVRYYSSTAVLLNELVKFFVCLYISSRESMHENEGRFEIRRVYQDIMGGDSWKMLIPAGLYTIQNNLQYVSVSLLDAATFQVTYQMKILTTALCSVLLLGTSLGVMRWVSLFVLTLGIILVQLPSGASTAAVSVATKAAASARFMGLVSVLVACVLSGLSGVYFEKVLKGSRKSVWTRNVQLSLFSMLPALFGVLVVDGKGVRSNGFFYGYTWWTLAAIACQAFGGLLVAVVVKYADNILKGFATSISIILSCLASVWLFDFHITKAFVVGTILVIYATYAYGKYSAPGADSKTGGAAPLPTSDPHASRSGDADDSIPLSDLVVTGGSDNDDYDDDQDSITVGDSSSRLAAKAK